MIKDYRIEVDCANCANLMEEATKKTEGVKDCVVNFMTLKMKVTFEEDVDDKKVMKEVLVNIHIEDSYKIKTLNSNKEVS